MTENKNIKSARKQFQVMRLKTNLLQMMRLPDDEADKKFMELSESLTKTFGANDAAEILLDATNAADLQFSNAMDNFAAKAQVPQTESE